MGASPLICLESGDAFWFPSREAAAGSMEPIDVRNREFVCFDESGRIFEPTVVEAPEGSQIRCVRTAAQVSQSDVERLRRFLQETLGLDLSGEGFEALVRRMRNLYRS